MKTAVRSRKKLQVAIFMGDDVAGEIGKSVPQRARQVCAGVSHGIVGGDCVRAGHMPPGAGCKPQRIVHAKLAAAWKWKNQMSAG